MQRTNSNAVRIRGQIRDSVLPAQLVADLRAIAAEFLALAYGNHLIERLLRDPHTRTRLRTSIERLLDSARATKN